MSKGRGVVVAVSADVGSGTLKVSERYSRPCFPCERDVSRSDGEPILAL